MTFAIDEIPVPPRCVEMIRAGALGAINHSGSKDSQAITVLLSRIVPHDRLVAAEIAVFEVHPNLAASRSLWLP